MIDHSKIEFLRGEKTLATSWKFARCMIEFIVCIGVTSSTFFENVRLMIEKVMSHVFSDTSFLNRAHLKWLKTVLC